MLIYPSHFNLSLIYKTVTKDCRFKMNYKVSLFMLSQIRKLSTSNLLNKNHYDSLGLTKNATQADVKGAYYELSKVYHPDKNQGHTAALRDKHSQKFRDITEAYEVLGNATTRRLYDKGFMGASHRASRPTTPDDPLHRFYKSRETRTRPPPPDGRTPIYDFDEWSRRHYGEAFQRGQEMKTRHAFRAKMRADDKDEVKLEIMVWGTLGFILFYCALMIFMTDYDNPSPTLKKGKDTGKGST